MTQQFKSLLIGTFVITAVILVFAALFILRPSYGDGERTLSVLFSDIDKVSVGTRVTYAGRPCGQVVAIEQQDGHASAQDHMGTVYTYKVTLEFDSHVTVYDVDEIMIKTSGLMGEKSVAIIPRHIPNQEPKVLEDAATVAATPSGGLEEAMGEIVNLTTTARQAANQIVQLIEVNRQELRLTILSLRQSAEDLENVLQQVLDTRLVENIGAGFTSFQKTMDLTRSQIEVLVQNDFVLHLAKLTQNLREITEAVNDAKALKEALENIAGFSKGLNDLYKKVDASWDTVDESLKDIRVAAGHTKELSTKVVQGQGNLGRFLKNEDLYLRSSIVLNKIDTLANDINHYGLLFHLDKGWQRHRARRVNVLEQITSPEQFHSYFNEEVGQVSTSLSRVAMLLEKAKSKDTAQMSELRQVFSELLTQVKAVEDTLLLYGQTLIEQTSAQTPVEAQ